MSIRQRRHPLHSDLILQKRAIQQLAVAPGEYFDFLGEIREEITEAQMIMLIDIHNARNAPLD